MSFLCMILCLVTTIRGDAAKDIVPCDDGDLTNGVWAMPKY